MRNLGFPTAVYARVDPVEPMASVEEVKLARSPGLMKMRGSLGSGSAARTGRTSPDLRRERQPEIPGGPPGGDRGSSVDSRGVGSVPGALRRTSHGGPSKCTTVCGVPVPWTRTRGHDPRVDPNVVGVGVGRKLVRGFPTRARGQVYVKQKIHPLLVKDGQVIPDEVGGVPTDVEETASSRSGAIPPITSGRCGRDGWPLDWPLRDHGRHFRLPRKDAEGDVHLSQ